MLHFIVTSRTRDVRQGGRGTWIEAGNGSKIGMVAGTGMWVRTAPVNLGRGGRFSCFRQGPGFGSLNCEFRGN